jgi:hypothetical protein
MVLFPIDWLFWFLYFKCGSDPVSLLVKVLKADFLRGHGWFQQVISNFVSVKKRKDGKNLF